MNYNVKTSKQFEKELKRLCKKYSSLKLEYIQIISDLAISPAMGTSLGNNLYKIRLSIASKRRGKSGGARIISYVQIIEESVLLLTIYDKGEKSNISDDEIQDILDQNV
jgi:mRNA-degrading endonuclease RelE of RelBE toxin-antitoxin system